MSRTLIAAVAALLFTLLPSDPYAAPVAHAGTSSPIEISTEALEVFLDEFLKANEYEYQGLGIVVTQGEQILLQKGIGYADDGRKVPVEPQHTVYNAASVGKLFVAMAVMQLYERGRIDLNANVDEYLTAFEVNENGYEQPVTLASLLTHTAGIESGFLDAEVLSPDDLVPMAEFFALRPPAVTFEPGSMISYSNHGMALAGHVVEAVSGQPFYKYTEENIFAPLKMERSTFRQPLPSKLEVDAAYDEFDDYLLPYPSGSLFTTVEDMSHFLIAQLNGGAYEGQQLLQPETLAFMHSQQFTHHVDVPGVTFGFFELFQNKQRALFHTGLRFHSSVLLLLPDDDVGVYLVGQIPEGSDLKADFVEAFLNEFYPAEEEAEAVPVPSPGLDIEDVNKYTGFYRISNVPQTNVEKLMGLGAEARVTSQDDGFLYVSIPAFGQPNRLIPLENGTFGLEDEAKSYFTFWEDDTGKVTHMFFGGRISDPFSLVSIPWYESGFFNLILGGAGLLLFISYLLVSLGRWLLRRRHGDVPSNQEMLAWRWGTMVSGLVVLSPVSFIVMLVVNDGPPALNGVPPIFYFLTGLVTLAALLGLALPVFAFRAWLRGYWSWPARVFYSLMGMAGIIMPLFLNYWNLLGFRF